MSEKSVRNHTIAGLFMAAAALSMIMVPFITGIRRTENRAITSFKASGRDVSIPAILFPQGNISVNEAEADELCDLYGIGETLAGMILDEREVNGPFFYPEDLTQVKGIGIKKLEGFHDMIDLN